MESSDEEPGAALAHGEDAEEEGLPGSGAEADDGQGSDAGQEAHEQPPLALALSEGSTSSLVPINEIVAELIQSSPGREFRGDLSDEDEDPRIVPRVQSFESRQQRNYSASPEDTDDDNGYLPGVDDLPLFATKEAKKLDGANKETESAVESTADKLNDMSERIKVMKEHLRNVQQEVEHTNALYVSKQAEIKTESHMHQLSIRALGRGKAETEKVNSELDLLQTQLNTVQNEIFRANERLDEFKLKMKWNQEELEKWAMAAKQKDEDALVLDKYARADEAKIKELSLQQETLTKEVQAALLRLEGEMVDTTSKQLELDRVAVEFRETHEERQTLLNRWQDTIEEMKRRDQSINELGERFAIAKAERAAKESRLNVQLRRLEGQISENKAVEAKSEALSKVVSRKREEMILGAQKLKEFRDELESIKNELTATSEQLVQKRAEIVHKSADLEEKRILLERQRVRYQMVKTKLESARHSAVRAEGTVKQVEEELAESERELETRLVSLKALKDRQFREAQLLFELRTEETRLRNEVDGVGLSCRSMDVHLNTLDKETARQQELLYNAEFQIQQSERKVARAMGVRSDAEKRELKKQIDELEKLLASSKEHKKLLVTQARKLHNELAASRMHKDVIALRRSKLQDKIGGTVCLYVLGCVSKEAACRRGGAGEPDDRGGDPARDQDQGGDSRVE